MLLANQLCCRSSPPHNYLISTFSSLAFLACTTLYLIEFTRTLGTIASVTDKQQPSSWLEKAISSLCVLSISQLKEHKVDLNTAFTHQTLMQPAFRKSSFFKSKTNMRIQRENGQ